MSEIKLFGAGWCRGCRQAKDWLVDNNVEYSYVDVDTEEGREEFQQTGYQAIPVLEVDSELVVGFDAGEYSRLITP